ncbi:MAG: BrnT family toxin [Bryobacterales bacterium]|nr:BrnT family toxin [Bryobacterales bacterium]
MGFEWDEANKARSNYRKHGVRMPEAIPVFDDPYAITIMDDESDPNEQRFVTARHGRDGPAARGRVHVARREHSHHFGSPAEAHERDEYEAER